MEQEAKNHLHNTKLKCKEIRLKYANTSIFHWFAQVQSSIRYHYKHKVWSSRCLFNKTLGQEGSLPTLENRNTEKHRNVLWSYTKYIINVDNYKKRNKRNMQTHIMQLLTHVAVLVNKMRHLFLQPVVFLHQQLVHGSELAVHCLETRGFFPLLLPAPTEKWESKCQRLKPR